MESIIQKDKDERLAAASSATEVLTKLNATIDVLPQKSQKILVRLAGAQNATGITGIDPIAVTLQRTQLISEQLEDEYELLKLSHHDETLQAKIDRNNKFITELRMELESSRRSLTRTPNPKIVQEVSRQLKQKVASYEESYDKAKATLSKLPVSDGILPMSLLSLVETLSALKEEESRVQARAEDVALARQAMHTLATLKR